ncbi:hypothetical protein X942_5535 [Burkholderia pseudomallei MSHR5596]|nr:hypothetical protein X942_5535 [Burkholderia pseudomallei MSHR5596]
MQRSTSRQLEGHNAGSDIGGSGRTSHIGHFQPPLGAADHPTGQHGQSRRQGLPLR